MMCHDVTCFIEFNLYGILNLLNYYIRITWHDTIFEL